jgi:hypothetical protein
MVIVPLTERLDVKDRVLILVSRLTNNRFSLIFSPLEWIGIVCAKLLLKKSYKEIIVLRGKNADHVNFQNTIDQLASGPGIKAIDVMINMHGGSNYLVFDRNTSVPYSAIVFADAARQKLRLLYSTACYGAAGNSWWLQKGFKVVIGAKAININAMTEYPKLLFAWAHGFPIGNAIDKANKVLDRIPDLLMRVFNKRIDSEKIIAGNHAITISSPPAA